MENTIVFFDDYLLKNFSGIRRRDFGITDSVNLVTFSSPRDVGGRILYNADRRIYRRWQNTLDAELRRFLWVRFYESEDLQTWHEVTGGDQSTDPESASGFITCDVFEPDPQKRYKRTYVRNYPDKTGDGYIATSPDGERWQDNRDYHFCNHISDSCNNVFYNPVSGEYQVILRGSHIERRIFSRTSPDLIHWSKSQCLMTPGPGDEPCTEYYGLVAFPQPGYFLGFLWKYLPPVFDSAKVKMSGLSDTYLVYSYDGHCWQEAMSRPVLERPLPPAYGSRGIYLSSLDEAPDPSSWIISGDLRRIDHGCGFKPVYPDSELPRMAREEGFAATGIYRIRKEGFVALESLSNQAEVTLKRIILNGNDLFFNICAPLGWARFQIANDQGVIPGFAFEDSVPFADDDQIRYRPQWKTRDLAELRGQSLIIQVRMNTALFYSVTGDFYNHAGYHPTISLGNMDTPVMI